MFIYEFKSMYNGYSCKPDVDFSEVDLIIPETYDDGENGELPVVEVSDFNDKGIKSVHLPNGLIRINTNTFNNNSIDSVTLGRNITFIGSGAFSNNNLTTIYYNPNIGNFTFGRFSNNSIKNLYLTPLNPEEEDKYYPLAGPINGDEGEFPITVTVPTSLYSEYTSDENWGSAVNNDYINIVPAGEIPSDYELTFAYDDAKSHYICTGLTGSFQGGLLEIPDHYDDGVNGHQPVGDIGSNAFSNLEFKITDIRLPRDIYFIRENAFANNNIRYLELRYNYLYTIEDSAFRNNGLEYLTIDSPVSYLGSYAFADNNIYDFVVQPNVSISASSGTNIFANNALRNFNIFSDNFVITSRMFENNHLTGFYIKNNVFVPIVVSNIEADNPFENNDYGVIEVTVNENTYNDYMNDSNWSWLQSRGYINIRIGDTPPTPVKDFRELGKMYSIPSNSAFKGFNLVTKDTINRMLNKEEEAKDGFIYISNEIGGGGGANSLSDLSDIKFEYELQPDQVLVFNGVFWSNKQPNTIWGLQSRDIVTFEYSGFPGLNDNYTIIDGVVNGTGFVISEALEVGKTYYQVINENLFNKFEITDNNIPNANFTANRELWVRGSVIL